MSSSAVSSSSPPAPVTRLYDDIVSSILGFLLPRDSSCAARTCKAWRNAALRNGSILYKQIAQNEFTQMVKQRYSMYAPREVFSILTTANNDFRRTISMNPRAKGVFDFIEEYIGEFPSKEIPLMSPSPRNPRQMYLEPYFGERAMRLAGIDPGPMVDLLPAQIPNEPCPFEDRKWAVYFPETVNGKTPCLETFRKINYKLTGSIFKCYLNNIPKVETDNIIKRPLGLSGWYHVVVVRENRKKPFVGLGGQEELDKTMGSREWQIASACQSMFVEILFNASGTSLLKYQWARSLEKTETGQHFLAVHGGSGGSIVNDDGPSVYKETSSGNSIDTSELNAVVALRKFPGT